MFPPNFHDSTFVIVLHACVAPPHYQPNLMRSVRDDKTIAAEEASEKLTLTRALLSEAVTSVSSTKTAEATAITAVDDFVTAHNLAFTWDMDAKAVTVELKKSLSRVDKKVFRGFEKEVKLSKSRRKTAEKTHTDCLAQVAKDKEASRKAHLKTSEYAGKAKGLAQLAWERGLIDGEQPAPCLDDLKKLMDGCTDFKNERSELTNLVEMRGHILLMSPKYHPEVAGKGVEYSWGKAKYHFRNHSNDCVAANLRVNVDDCLSAEVLTLDRVHKFARRSRDYKRIYEDIRDNKDGAFKTESSSGRISREGDSETGFKLYEKIKRKYREHRNMKNIDSSFINNA